MKSEFISDRQGISVVAMFVIGSAIVLGSGTGAKQDVWASILIGMVFAIPLIFVYSVLLLKLPQKDIFDILFIAYGNFFGKIISLLFVWYTFHLGALVIRNFSEFIQIVSFPETPQFYIAIVMILLCIWVAKAGIEVLGRWAAFIFPLVLIQIVGLVILSIPLMDIDRIRPAFYNGIQPVIQSAYSALTFPFAEIVVFTAVFNTFKERKSIKKVFFLGSLIAGILILIASLRNLLVLGVIASKLYFTSYSSVSLIKLGDFFQRIEVMVSVGFLFAGFVKVSICLLATVKGVSKVLGIKNYKGLIVPIGLLMFNLSCIIYSNTMEMFYWAHYIYKYYAIPFQIIIPIVTLIIVQIKTIVRSNT